MKTIIIIIVACNSLSLFVRLCLIKQFNAFIVVGIICQLFCVVMVVIKQYIMIRYNVYVTWLVAIILLLVACG